MHCVNLYIFKTPEEKLEFPHVEHNGYVLVPITDKLIKTSGCSIQDDDFDSSIKTFLLGKSGMRLVWATTDYFGGAGEQEAAAWICDKTTKNISINKALELLGISERPDGQDAFDFVCLGNYRTNQAIIDEWELINGKTREVRIRRTILRTKPDVLETLYTACRVYINKEEYYESLSNNKYLHVKEILTLDDTGLVKKIITKKSTQAEYNLARENAFSIVHVDYPIQEEGCDTFRIISTNSSVSIMYADIIIWADGSSSTHPELMKYIIDDCKIPLYTWGLTGKNATEEIKPIPQRRIIYDCPKCGNEMKETETRLICSCGFQY